VLARLSTIAVVATLAAASLHALDPKSLQPQGYVSDFAGVVDAAARAEINKYCAAVERATGAQIAIVTVKTLEGAPPEDFANELFRQWGVGPKESQEGVLLLFAIDDRHSRVEVGRGLEPIITDGASGAMLRDMRPALRSGNYGGAFRAAAQSLGDRIAKAKGVSIDEGDRPAERSRDTSSDLPVPVVLFLFFLLAMFLIGKMRGGGGGRGGRYRGGGGGGGFLPGLILGSVLNRPSYGGQSGGGFGGYDSGGGGFGGFGGFGSVEAIQEEAALQATGNYGTAAGRNRREIAEGARGQARVGCTLWLGRCAGRARFALGLQHPVHPETSNNR
jgi:uncharacterized protein